MDPLKKNDVKNHLSTHDRNGRHLHVVPTVADATGFSNEESGHTEVVVTEECLEQTKAPGRPALVPTVVATTSKRERA